MAHKDQMVQPHFTLRSNRELEKIISGPDIMAHTYDPSTQECSLGHSDFQITLGDPVGKKISSVQKRILDVLGTRVTGNKGSPGAWLRG